MSLSRENYDKFKSFLNCEIGGFNLEVMSLMDDRPNTFHVQVLPNSVTEEADLLENVRKHKYENKIGVIFLEIYMFIGTPSNSVHIACDQMFIGHKTRKRNIEFLNEEEFQSKVKKKIVAMIRAIYREAEETYNSGFRGEKEAELINRFGNEVGAKVSNIYHKTCSSVTFNNGINLFKEEFGELKLTGVSYDEETIGAIIKAISSVKNKG